MPEGRRPRGVTPCPKSGAAAKSTRLLQLGGAPARPHEQLSENRARLDSGNSYLSIYELSYFLKA